MNQKVSKLSFFQDSMHFHSACATFVPQFHVAVEQFGAKNIPLVSRRLIQLGVGKNFRLLMQSCCFFLFFSPDLFMKISNFSKLSIRFSRNFAQSFYTQRGPCVCKGIKIVWPGCEKHSQN